MNTKRMVILGALAMLVLSSMACGGGGDGDAPEATDTPAPVEIELVPLLKAVDDALEDANSGDPGAILCISASGCKMEGMNCDLELFAACKEYDRVSGEPLECYTQ